MDTRSINSGAATPALLPAVTLPVHIQSQSGNNIRPGAPLAGFRLTRHEQYIRVKLNQRYSGEIEEYSQALQKKDSQLYQHSQRVLSLTLRLARVLDLADKEVMDIALAAFLHDIGKIAIDDGILQKRARLTPDEYAIVQQHSIYGARLLERHPSLHQLSPLILHHHERWDGQGYPFGLTGTTIPQGARIIAIADAFEAMTAHRQYQPQRKPREALEELHRYAGTQFDARLVKLFCGSQFYSEAENVPGIS